MSDQILEDNLICPYCGYQFDEPYNYLTYNEEEIECLSCGKKFWLEVDYKYTTRTLDHYN